MLKEGGPFNLYTKLIHHLPSKVRTHFALQSYPKANNTEKGKTYIFDGCIYYFILMWHIFHLPPISFSPPKEEEIYDSYFPFKCSELLV